MIHSWYYKRGRAEVEQDVPTSRFSEVAGGIGGENGLLWIDILRPEIQELESLEKCFGFHPLTIEDCVLNISHPKLDHFDQYLFLVVHAARFERSGRDIKMGTVELDIFLGRNYVVTVHAEPVKSIVSMEEKCLKNPQVMGRGSDMFVVELLDTLVENYMPPINALSEAIEVLEDEVLTNPTRMTLERIFTLQKDVIHLSRTLMPQGEIIKLMARDTSDLINKKNKIYFDDIYDHIYRFNSIISYLRDASGTLLDGYGMMVNTKIQEAVKVMTVIATIMLPPVIFSSLYGANFKFLPFADWEHGFWGMLLLSVLMSAGMTIWFRKRGWY